MQVLPSDYKTAQTYQLALNVAKRCSDLPLGLALTAHMREGGMPPTLFIYTNLATVCAREGDADAAFRLYAEMQTVGMRPDVHFLSALMASCATAVQRLKLNIQAGNADAVSGKAQVRPLLAPLRSTKHAFLF